MLKITIESIPNPNLVGGIAPQSMAALRDRICKYLDGPTLNCYVRSKEWDRTKGNEVEEFINLNGAIIEVDIKHD